MFKIDRYNKVDTRKMTLQHAKYNIGQLIKHKIFDYRGVIVDVDPVFQGSDEWYDEVAQSCPPKDKPWYKVLVHNSDQETYVAERNLDNDSSLEPVDHPLIEAYFKRFNDGHYLHTQHRN